jgi:ferrous iron transport protein B
MGFGCSVPAMVNTRTLKDQRERTMTLRVIPFFSCGAKLPILSAVAGAIGYMFGLGDGSFIAYSMYVVGMIVAVITIIIMHSTTQGGEVSPFIMELPAYHAPSKKSLVLLLWDKTKHYLQKVFTVILVSTIVIWFVSNFGWDWRMTDIDHSILASLGRFLQPIFTPLGFGSQLGSFGWVFIVAAVTGLIAKENVIATFGTLSALFIAFAGQISVEGAAEVVTMAQNTGITWQGLIAFIVFNLTTIPCFAAVATAKGETPKGKFKWTILFWVVSSYLASSITYLVLSWWWTAFIVLAVGGVAFVGIKAYKKLKTQKR